MPKKKTTSRPKSRKKNLKRPQSKNIVIVLSFLVILGLLIFGLSYIKNTISVESQKSESDTTIAEKPVKPKKADSSADLNKKIAEVDGLISQSFFNLGLSKKNIVKKSSIQKKSGSYKWKFTDQELSVSDNLSKQKIISNLQKKLKTDNTKLGFYTLDDHLYSEVSVNGYQTHKLRFIFDYDKKAKLEEKKKEKVVASIKKEKTKDKEIVKKEKAVFSGKKAKISIIVDDIGQDRRSIDKLISISPKLTFAILPHLPYSRYSADRAKKVGSDILLHLPMEPKSVSGYNADDAGEGVLMVGQTKSEIVRIVSDNLSAVPYAIGVNNHMGSKFTENGELMELVLRELSKKGLFYVDSQTSGKSKGYSLAKQMGMKSAYRDVFLDRKDLGKDYVKKQLRSLVKKAKKRGYAVGICHPYSQTIQALKEELPKLGDSVEISSISSILNQY